MVHGTGALIQAAYLRLQELGIEDPGNGPVGEVIRRLANDVEDQVSRTYAGEIQALQRHIEALERRTS